MSRAIRKHWRQHPDHNRSACGRLLATDAFVEVNKEAVDCQLCRRTETYTFLATDY